MLISFLNLFRSKVCLSFLVIVAGLLGGCYEGNDISKDNEEGVHRSTLTIEIDPVFRSFYEHHGGDEVFGRAISPVQKKGSSEYQCTEAACIMFNPNQPENDRFKLASLGNEMGIFEPQVPDPHDDAMFINGHIIYHEFVPLYQKLGGMNFVGRPLTEVRFNPHAKRFEQFYENLGLYRSVSAQPGTVKLLAYGTWSCGSFCQDRSTHSGAVDIYPNIALPFNEFVQRIGTDLTGFPLTKAYLAPDGKIEQIFERVVLAFEPGVVDRVILRKLPVELGLPINERDESGASTVMGSQQNSGINGYDIPIMFWEFIENHGGFSVSGAPISNPAFQKDELYKQCFENYCMKYDGGLGESNLVKPEMLGYAYRDIYYQNLPSVSRMTTRGDEVILQAWAKYSSIGSEMEQEFWARVMKNDVLLQEGELFLIQFLPDGDHMRMEFPLTLEDGRTSIVVPSIHAPNGTLIPFQVCMVTEDGQDICVSDNYLIWNLP